MPSKLDETGILTKESVGNQIHYQANPDCPIFEELRQILKKITELDRDLDLRVDIEKGQSGLALGGFLSDVSELVQDAVIRNLQVMAKSSQRLADDINKTYPDFPWK